MLQQWCSPCALRKGIRLVVFVVATTCLALAGVLGLAIGLVWAHGERKPAPVVAATAPSATAPDLQGPKLGEVAPDFTLRDLDGNKVHLGDWQGRMPVVIEFGSLSCPLVRGHAAALDDLAREYEGQVQFLFVYGNEEHPGNGGRMSTTYGTACMVPQVKDHHDRAEHAGQFQRETKVSRRVLVDEDGADSVVARYGRPQHQVVVVDAQGRLCWRGGDPSPSDLQRVLGQEVGGPSPSAGVRLAP